jgi:hypothetical protein
MTVAPMGRRSLLRRPQGALGAAPILRSTEKADFATRPSASEDATAGFARAAAGYGEAAIPAAQARAPAVAIAVIVAALWWVPASLADEAPPPPTTPTATTPDAPPPDPYHAPATAPKPKTAVPKRSAPVVVHSAPPVRTRSYSPPVTRSAPVRSTPTHRVKHVRAKKVVAHKTRKHVVRRHVAPKPVKVTFTPFADLVATAATLSLPTGDGGQRDRYLRFAGLAFAVLAAAALSLQLFSTRFFRVRVE